MNVQQAMRSAVTARLVAGFRSIVSGDSTGRPDWVRELESGDDEGYFGPGSAVWAVHGDIATLVGGVRALLMQTLHPAAVTGVDEHSSYRQDALGRLAGTSRWLTVTTFGSRALADREAARVRGLHRRVRGTYLGADGVERPYRAGDDRLLAWVHAAFTDSFLTAYQVFGAAAGRADAPDGPWPALPSAGRAADGDAYVRQWALAAELVGVSAPPRSVAELDREIAAFAPELCYSEATRRTLDFLRNPPLPAPARPGYAVLYAAAASTLRPEHRELLRLPSTGTRVPRLAGRTMLQALRVVLGEGPPARLAAQRRLDSADAA